MTSSSSTRSRLIPLLAGFSLFTLTAEPALSSYSSEQTKTALWRKMLTLKHLSNCAISSRLSFPSGLSPRGTGLGVRGMMWEASTQL